MSSSWSWAWRCCCAVAARRFRVAPPVLLLACGALLGFVPALGAPGPCPIWTCSPRLASVLGVDLNPLDVRDPDARRWLEALVWPENHRQPALLSAALADAAADPPTVRAGDAIDVLPGIAG